jgi:TonB-linked SusC/RagA family outer membrane protein
MKNNLLNHVAYMTKLFTIAFAIQCLTMSLLFAMNGKAQVKSIEKVNVFLSLRDVKLETAFKALESQTNYNFVFATREVRDLPLVSFDSNGESLYNILANLAVQANVNFKQVDKNIHVRKSDKDNTVTVVEAADITVTGTVTDATGEPIPGVTISLVGAAIGTATDLDGRYAVTVPEGSTLVFSFIGYESQRISVGGRSIIDVVLNEDMTSLDEVVVVGYGVQKKVNLTGSVDVISNEKLSNRQAPTVSQMLQGLSPGLNFDIADEGGFQPGAGMKVTVRGMGSLNGGAPFVVIDGFPGSMDNLNPEDIESISVLKDAAASAIYGARAPYGVILITTKNGKKNEKISVSYSGNVFINTPPVLPESLDSHTWTRIQNEAGDNRGGRPFSNQTIDQIIAFQNQDWAYLDEFMPDGTLHYGAFPQGNIWNNANLNYANTDWWDVYYGHSVNQKHGLTVSGGSDRVTYYFSVGHLVQGGVLNYGIDNFSRTNVSGKVHVAVNDKWDFGWESRLTKKYRELPSMTNTGNYLSMFRSIGRAYPITPVLDGWGNYTFESHIPSIIYSGTRRTDDYDAWNTFRTEIRPLKGWKINADFAFNLYSGIQSNLQKAVNVVNVDQTRTPSGSHLPNSIERFLTNNTYWSSNIFTSYEFNLGQSHNLSVMAGLQLEKGLDAILRGYKTDLITDDIPSLQTATGVSILSEELPHRATQGYFSRINYNYKEKYLFEANARYDGSYVFRESKRWGFFPSFSLGWNIDREAFWENVEDYVSGLKIRASWGQLGNQQVSPYSDLELIPIQTAKLDWIFNYGQPRRVGYTTAPGIVNRDLTWETATTKNIGVNATFLDNKLQADFDLFERLTTDMIGPSEAKPGVLGASVPRDNNAELRTRGWELALTWQHDLKNDWSYFVKFNIADYKSVVTKYFNPTGTLSTWYEGREVGEIWGYQVNDLFRTQEELNSYRSTTDLSFLGVNWNTGDLKFEDTNGDGKVNNGTNTVNDHGDLSIIGNESPRYQLGATLGASYKGFDFSMLWSGVGKRDIYFRRSANLFWGFMNGWWESTLTPGHLDYFRDKPGDKYVGLYEGEENINIDAYWPRPYLNATDEAKNKDNPNTRYLQNGAYLRLQNVQLGYSFPKEMLSRLKLQTIRIYFSGENLLLFTGLPNGMDPITPIGGPSTGAPNSGRLTYGADRTYSLGVNITY